MFRTLNAPAALLWLGLCLGLGGCQGTGTGAIRPPAGPSRPSILAEPPPQVRLRAPQGAILSDQVVGLPRRAGVDHLSAAEEASNQPDQAAALAEFVGWGWLDGASRTWSVADEVLVLTARPEGAIRAFGYWAREAGEAPYLVGGCSSLAAAGLDDCAQGVSAGRAIVVGRLGPAVFRIACPIEMAERLTIAQVAALPPEPP